MPLEPLRISAWIEPLVKKPDEIADVFLEIKRELTVDWRDGRIVAARAAYERGVSARWRRRREEALAFVSRGDETGVREAIRALQISVNRPPIPVKPARDAAPEPDEPDLREGERWMRRLEALFERHAPRHRFRFVPTESTREIVPAHAAACAFSRRLLSLEGTLTPA